MQFQDDVVGGVTLIRPAIQSPNFVTGTTGWTINADGTAEFSDLTIRSSDGSNSTITIANGEIEIENGASVVVTTISADGYKLYHPVTGDLLAEATLSGGSDSLPGFIAYSQLAPDSYVYMGDNNIEFGDNSTSMALNPSLSSSGLGSGNDDNVSLFLTGGKINGSSTAPHLRLETAASGSGNATITADTIGGTGACDLLVTGDVYIDSVEQGRGLQDFTAITANAATITTTETVGITSGSVGFLTGRTYRATVRAWVQSSVTGDAIQTRLRKTNAAGQQLFDTFRTAVITGANTQSSVSYEAIFKNTSGATVTAALAVTYVRALGTGNVFMGANATNPSWIQIEDIGPAADYPSVNAIT